MAKFDYTKKTWDKEKASALPSTGLGKALTSYEASLKQLIGLKVTDNNIAQIQKALKDTLDKLAAVETTRAKAIKTAGKLFSGTKKFLETADPNKQLDAIQKALSTMVLPFFIAASKDIDDAIDSLKSKIQHTQVTIDFLKDIKKARSEKKKYKQLTEVYLSEGDSLQIEDIIGKTVKSIIEIKPLRRHFAPIENRIALMEVKASTFAKAQSGYRKAFQIAQDRVKQVEGITTV